MSSFSKKNQTAPPPAFTLVEMLVSLAIIGIIMFLGLSFVKNATNVSGQITAQQSALEDIHTLLYAIRGKFRSMDTAGLNVTSGTTGQKIQISKGGLIYSWDTQCETVPSALASLDFSEIYCNGLATCAAGTRPVVTESPSGRKYPTDYQSATRKTGGSRQVPVAAVLCAAAQISAPYSDLMVDVAEAYVMPNGKLGKTTSRMALSTREVPNNVTIP